jgi:hypothetical protein
MTNEGYPLEGKANSNHIRQLAIIISELGEITELGLSYENEINIARCAPFNEITDVASKQLKSVVKEESTNVIRRWIYRIRNFIKSKSAQMIDDGKMTEYEIQEVFGKFKTKVARLKWQRRKVAEQEKKKNREAFKDSIRINGIGKSNLDAIGEEEFR